MKTYILFFSILIIAGLVYYFGFSQKEVSVFDGLSEEMPQESQTAENTENELVKEVLQPGAGRPAENGDTVVVHYTGTLLDGTKFDSSLDGVEPFSFVLGVGQVIDGWEQGVLGMQAGEKRKLIVPPSLAYGNRAVGGVIPANSTLVFEIELLEIR